MINYSLFLIFFLNIGISMKNKRINILFESYKRKATHKDENKTNSIFGKNRNVKNILLD